MNKWHSVKIILCDYVCIDLLKYDKVGCVRERNMQEIRQAGGWAARHM
jgi:hypothetical protein